MKTKSPTRFSTMNNFNITTAGSEDKTNGEVIASIPTTYNTGPTQGIFEMQTPLEVEDFAPKSQIQTLATTKLSQFQLNAEEQNSVQVIADTFLGARSQVTTTGEPKKLRPVDSAITKEHKVLVEDVVQLRKRDIKASKKLIVPFNQNEVLQISNDQDLIQMSNEVIEEIKSAKAKLDLIKNELVVRAAANQQPISDVADPRMILLFERVNTMAQITQDAMNVSQIARSCCNTYLSAVKFNSEE